MASKLLDRLTALKLARLPIEDQLALLRAYQLCFIRLGEPASHEVVAVVAQLNDAYPTKEERLNTELCRVLSYLNAPDVVSKTIALMKETQTRTVDYDEEMLRRHEYGQIILESMANSPNVQNIQYAYSLRRVKKGWALEDRRYYFEWLNETLTKSGGKSFAGHVRAIRRDAIAHLTEDATAAVGWLLGDIATVDLAALPAPEGPAVNWTHEKAVALFDGELKNRNFENGKKMFSAGMCTACHRIEGEGGYSGPDLGSVGKRYSVSDILKAIVDPSDSISEQYQASEIEMKDGTTQFGRLIYRA